MRRSLRVRPLENACAPAKHKKKWLDFWTRYREEKQTLAQYYGGELSADTQLELLNMNLSVNFRLPTGEQLAAVKWKEQERRANAAKRK
ncbi:hypothetical protein [Calycomorphotria hydatis]|nr:hypothetical protein [Calycomorphotria hydatis]